MLGRGSTKRRFGELTLAAFLLFSSDLVLAEPGEVGLADYFLQDNAEIEIRQESSRGGRTFNGLEEIGVFQVTAYHDKGLTKSGVPAGPGSIAVDPSVIPLGTKLYVEGYGFGKAVDTGRLVKGQIVDVWMEQRKDCIDWGRQTRIVYIMK